MFAALLMSALTATVHPPDGNPVPVVQLTVSPAAAPSPALKYELLPRAHEKHPGDAAAAYARAFLALAENQGGGRTVEAEKVRKWLDAPAAEFPVAEAKALLKSRDARLRDVEKASLLDRCHWHLNERVRADGLNALLPEVQPVRETAILLLLRARVEAVEGRGADAVRSIRTALQMARHVGDGACMINNLVGTAVGLHAANRIEELIQAPNGPNLYWALCGLPRPFTDVVAALEGDALMLPGSFSIFREFQNGPVSEGEAGRVVDRFQRQLREAGGGATDPWDGFVANVGLAFLLAQQKDAAKKELIAAGRDTTDLEKMAAAQLVFLASWERYKKLLDNEAKWFRQPYPVALAGLKETRRRFRDAKDNVLAKKDIFAIAFVLMTPAFDKVFTAHLRLERRLAALRVIEAVRMHAAASDGALPDTLAAITVVHVPDDPYTGKPFVYTRTGGTATLDGPPPDGADPTVDNTLRYELTLRKK